MVFRKGKGEHGIRVYIILGGVWSLMLGVVFPGLSEDLGEGMVILKKMSEVYRTLESYQFEGLLTRETTAEGFLQRREVPILKAAVLPDKMHVESGWPSKRIISVFNGENSWLYFTHLRQYSKSTPGEMKQIMEIGPNSEAGSVSSLAASFVTDYGTLAEQVSEVKLLRTETLSIEGLSIECSVLEFADPGQERSSPSKEFLPRTLWVENKRFIVLKDTSGTRSKSLDDGEVSESHQTIVLQRARINEPLSEDLFTFVPPEGVKEFILPGFVRSRRKMLQGEVSMDFTLEDLSGEKVNLKSLRGKVVLLNFWASWCGPCRIEMPYIDKLQKEFKGKGLVVLGINDEEPDIARDYLRKNHITFRSLIDIEQEVSLLYQVTAIPTVFIIDRQGKISFQEVGLSREEALREALSEAGIHKF